VCTLHWLGTDEMGVIAEMGEVRPPTRGSRRRPTVIAGRGVGRRLTSRMLEGWCY